MKRKPWRPNKDKKFHRMSHELNRIESKIDEVPSQQKSENKVDDDVVKGTIDDAG